MLILVFLAIDVIGLVASMFWDEDEHPIIVKIMIVITVSGLIATIIASIFYTNSIGDSTKCTANQTIVNLKDNRDIKGQFFMRRGYIDTEAYYYYYYITDTGSYRENKIRADKCEIVYTNSTPHIEIYQTPDENLLNYWLLYLLESDEYYKIYVPEGSITDDFSIDME